MSGDQEGGNGVRGYGGLVADWIGLHGYVVSVLCIFISAEMLQARCAKTS